MKAKKFLKIVKFYCTDTNCETHNCPMYDKKHGCLMLAGDSVPEGWNIKKMIKAAKKAGKKAWRF